jgi:hypothetical protein
MKKIVAPAIKTPSGKVVKGTIKGEHKAIDATGKKGFVDSDGKFDDRKTAAKIAVKAGQSRPVKSLHTHNLKGK